MVEVTDTSELGASYGTGTGTIINDDTAEITISSEEITEGTGDGFSEIIFTVSTSNPVDIDLPINVDFTDLTATGFDFDPQLDMNDDENFPLPFGADFDNDSDETLGPIEDNGSTSLVTFAAGSTADQSVFVRVVQDDIVEGGVVNSEDAQVFGSETFRADISTTVTDRASDTDDTGIGTINDDDSATVSIVASDPLAAEPTATGGDGEFTITLSNPVQGDVVIDLETSVDGSPGDPNGDVEENTPFDDQQITIPGSTFDAGATTSVIIPIVAEDDDQLEDDEAVVVSLDELPTVLNDPNVSIGDLINSIVSDEPVVDETTTTATVTIVDDETTFISIVATDPTAQESDTFTGVANAGTATFRVEILEAADVNVTFDLRIVDGEGNLAEPEDYTGLPETVTIEAGQTFTDIVITAAEDVLPEDPETLTVELVPGSSVGNADVVIDPDASSATVTILDDFDGLTLSVVNLRDASEPGIFDDELGIFQIQLQDANGNPAILKNGSTASGSLEILYSITGTATAPTQDADGDFTGLSGVAQIAEGTSFINIPLDVVDDFDPEDPETVILTIDRVNDDGVALIDTTPGDIEPTGELLGDGEPISIGLGSATVTIIDDDSAAVAFATASVKVASSAWAPEFIDEIDPIVGGIIPDFRGFEVTDPNVTLPWVNLNTIIVEFAEGIDVSEMTAANFNIAGQNIQSYDITEVEIVGNSVALTVSSSSASAAPLAVDRLVLTMMEVPGGLTGAVIRQQLNVLPGDVNGDGSVNVVDTLNIRSAQFSSVGDPESNYSVRKDLTGDANINVIDTLGARLNQFTSLPPVSSTPLRLQALFGSSALETESQLSDSDDYFSGTQTLKENEGGDLETSDNSLDSFFSEY